MGGDGVMFFRRGRGSMIVCSSHDDPHERYFAVAMSRCVAMSLSANLETNCRGRNGEIEIENGGNMRIKWGPHPNVGVDVIFTFLLFSSLRFGSLSIAILALAMRSEANLQNLQLHCLYIKSFIQ